MVKKTGVSLLFYCTALWPIFLVGCTPTLQVYEDQYVIERYVADGPFHPWHEHTKPTKELPAGLYNIHATGIFELVSPRLGALSESKLVDYDPQTDLCLTNEMRDFVCAPNFLINGVLSNDPYDNKLWGLKNPPGLDIASIVTDKRTPDVKVMVLDTGVSPHEDLTLSHLSYNAITGSTASRDADDDNGHGTHVAGTICATANNGKGISGVSESCPIIPAKFLAASGSGSLYNAIKAIRWAIDNEIDIINASFGGGGYAEPFQSVINEATEKGILIIAAAGNNSNDNDINPHYPSNYTNVLSVASVSQSGGLSSFSNYGDNTVHVSAPGNNIYSLSHLGGYLSLNGTSMASPHVAGLAAIIYQRNKDKPRTERRKIAWESLTKGVRPQKGVKYGQIDAVAVLEGAAPGCQKSKCKQCFRDCSSAYECKCSKWRNCKKTCRSKTGCGFGCQ